MDELIRVQALASAWCGRAPTDIVGGLLEVLVRVLGLDLAYARIEESIDGSPIEAVRLSPDDPRRADPRAIGRALAREGIGDGPAHTGVTRNPIGDGDVSVVYLRLGLLDELGIVVAAARRAGFPEETELALLRAAANQAMIGLQEAGRRREQRWAAVELERQVAARTVELTATNEALHNEVAERQRVTESLRRSEAYLADGQRLSHTGSWAWNLSTGELFWSREHFRIFGLDSADTSPSYETFFRMIHPDDRRSIKEGFDRAVRDRTDHEAKYRIVRPDGTIRDIQSISHPVVDDVRGLTEYVGTVIDLTDRNRAEDERQTLASLIEHSTDFIAIASLDGDVLFVNPAGQRMVGLDGSGPVRGTRVLDYVPPEDRERLEHQIIPDVIRDGRWEGETRFRHFRTGAVIPMLQHVFLIGERGGRVIGMGTISRDISERKDAEEALSRRREELTRVNRTMVMGVLAASIAHEVNQPLAAVVTNGAACLRWLGGPEPNMDEAREALDRLIQQATRAGHVIARIRALLGRSGSEKERLRLNEAIGEVVPLTAVEVRRNAVSLRTELAETLPPVWGDRVQLQQVVLNLVINGIEAMSGITDRTRELVVGTHDEGGGTVRVSVRDSGVGVGAAIEPRIFEALYTTKPRGMGIGLSISRAIVEEHQGRLWATRNEGPGMTFHFTLPVIRGE